MMRNDDFCAFVLTHGRPDKVHTFKSLQKHGYTGKVFIVIDDEDKAKDRYIEEFGDSVLIFSKAAIAETFDEGDNFNDRRAIIYARNACFELAKQVGCTYFIQLDDDYTDFRYKINDKGQYIDRYPIKDLDSIFDMLVDYYKTIPALSIAMAQGGDFIGGRNGSFAQKRKLKRKCMNTFICSTERPFSFIGRINEDVNTYTNLAGRGGLFLTVPDVAIQQLQTQSNTGGMTELYLDSGTYVKSFYSIMYSPSCVKISEMGAKHKRLHHKVNWACAVPCIIDESFKKKA